MAIVTQCPECGKKLKAPETQLGKKAKCPQCKNPFTVAPIEEAAGSDAPAAKQSAAAGGSSKAKIPASLPKRPLSAATGGKLQPREDWYLQTAEGEEYGPVSKHELDEWFAEGRIDVECQLLREGWEQWKWAEEIYPEIGDGDAAADGDASETEEENPFAGIGEEAPSATADEDALAGLGAAAGSKSGGSSAKGNRAAVVPPQAEFDNDGAAVTPAMLTAMRETKPWILVFLVIAGLACLFPIVLAILALVMMFGSVVAGLVLLFAAAIYGVIYGGIAYFLFKYFQSLSLFTRGGDGAALEACLIDQKNFWKFAGILTVTMIGLTLVFNLLWMALGVGAAMSLGG